MEKFSAGRISEGEGPSRRCPLRKSRNHQRRINLRDGSSEEEETVESDDYVKDDDTEESEEDDAAGAGNVGKRKMEGCGLNGSTSWTVSDPEVLDCPVCYELLTIPVSQCDNGHIACSTCCTCAKLKNKCPSCGSPIGYKRCRAIERVLESVEVICQNRKQEKNEEK